MASFSNISVILYECMIQIYAENLKIQTINNYFIHKMNMRRLPGKVPGSLSIYLNTIL